MFFWKIFDLTGIFSLCLMVIFFTYIFRYYISVSLGSGYHQTTNGQYESMNQELGRFLMVDGLPWVLFANCKTLVTGRALCSIWSTGKIMAQKSSAGFLLPMCCILILIADFYQCHTEKPAPHPRDHFCLRSPPSPPTIPGHHLVTSVGTCRPRDKVVLAEATSEEVTESLAGSCHWQPCSLSSPNY